jgi:hypothetical protein
MINSKTKKPETFHLFPSPWLVQRGAVHQLGLQHDRQHQARPMLHQQRVRRHEGEANGDLRPRVRGLLCL